MSGLSDLLAIVIELAFNPILSLALTQSQGDMNVLHLVKGGLKK